MNKKTFNFPRMRGFDSTCSNGLDGVTSRAFDQPIYRDMEELSREMRVLNYSQIDNPRYSEECSQTVQSERNRKLLLWALERNIEVPEGIRTTEEYSNVETEILLYELFSTKQIQNLQGVLVYNILDRAGQKGLPEDNTLAIGGITYSQSEISNGNDSLVEKIIAKQLAVPKIFKEPGILPDFMRGNVQGTIHIVPYGETTKISGKERETLLMIADDFITLIKHLEKPNDNVDYPRFIKNTTNPAMGAAAKKYFKAQVAEIGEAETIAMVLRRITMDAMGKVGGIDNNNMVDVFISEQDLENMDDSLADLREELYQSMKGEREIDMDEMLKEIRIDAIMHLLNKFKFE